MIRPGNIEYQAQLYHNHMVVDQHFNDLGWNLVYNRGRFLGFNHVINWSLHGWQQVRSSLPLIPIPPKFRNFYAEEFSTLSFFIDLVLAYPLALERPSA